jgi:hypothetical protein
MQNPFPKLRTVASSMERNATAGGSLVSGFVLFVAAVQSRRSLLATILKRFSRAGAFRRKRVG